MRSVVYRIFVVLPCRTYRGMASAAGAVPVLALLVILGAAVVGGGVAWGIAAVAGGGRDEALLIGPIIGLSACIVWLVYTAVVVGILTLLHKDHSVIARQRRPTN